MQLFTYDTPLIRGATFSRAIQYSTNLCRSTTSVAINLGSATFSVPTNLVVPAGARIRASLVSPPVDDATQFVEGPEISYNSTLGMLDITLDTIGGIPGAVYSSWQLVTFVDLTGASFDAIMRLSPDSCAGRARPSVNLTINVTGDPKTGTFTMYLTPAQTAALVLGNYQYRVFFTPASSSDKFPILSGVISVIDA